MRINRSKLRRKAKTKMNKYSMLILCLCFLQLGCVYRHANVYVKAVRPDNSTVEMDVYDGRSGMHLGQTTFTLYLKRRVGAHTPPLSLIARPTTDTCPSYWQIVNVENWGKTPAEAADATKKNEVIFKVRGDLTCP